MNRLGVMGGTFDPIHHGHLFIAEEARVHFGLEQVLFIPNNTPPHKDNRRVSDAQHRFAMTELAVASNPHFACSSLELDREGASYTVETLLALRQQHPGTELFYLTGVDAVAEILTWKRHEEVIQLARFVAAARSGYEPEILAERLPRSYQQRIEILHSPALEISSTDLRRRIAENRPIRYLVPDDVVEYIEQNELYRNTEK
jgi:nicotinate-nucleotide adenylyltransferase